MIRVERNGRSVEGIEIRPSTAWKARSAAATARAISEAAGHVVDDEIYGADEVRGFLFDLFYGKCAYCEAGLERAVLDVEHYRPKGAVAEDLDHDGYYWLAYTWENLYPSCPYCNQRRKQPGVAGTPSERRARGKKDAFPLRNPATRARNPSDDLAREERLLIDPCMDDPEQHLAYDPAGQIRPAANSDMGDTTIDLLALDAARLRRARRQRLATVVQLLRLCDAVLSNQVGADAKREARKTLALLDEPHQPFAGLTRYVLKHRTEFGL